jgi:glycosyltransferase involved in cell wall biosynthesis
LLTFSTLYPSSVRPGHGIFVETRLRELVASGQVVSKVVAPVPWFFSGHPVFGRYAHMAQTPRRELRHGLDVQHPRYALPPRLGMNMAPLLLAWGARPAVQKLLNEGYDFDVMDAHYYYPDGVAAALLARHFKKPLTITARGSDINLLARYRLPRTLMCWAAQQAQASIGVSAALTQAMAQLPMPAATLLTLPNGVDLNRFHLRPQGLARGVLGWPLVPTLLLVGNLQESKGQQLALQALPQLPTCRLVLVGDGPQRASLQQLARRLNVAERVLFMGPLDQDHLATCYSAADVLLLPSSREGWPNVVLEAMACGTPVVATRVGGIADMVNSPVAGCLMSERSVPELVAAVQRLMQQLPARAAVRTHASAHTWARTTAAQQALFSRIAATYREQGDA